MTALVCARDARIDVDDGRRLEGLDFVIDAGARISFAGDFTPLWFWLLGAARLEQGSLTLCGHERRAALAAGLVGLGPGAWRQRGSLKGGALLEQSARFLPSRGGTPRALARETLHALGAEALESLRLRQMSPSQQRVLALSHALLGEPRCVFLEEPFCGVPVAEHAYVLEALERATRRATVIALLGPVPRAGAARAWLERSDRILLAVHQFVVAGGSFAELSGGAERYRVVVARHAAAFVAALAERGLAARTTVSPGVLPNDERATELWVSVGAGEGTRPLLAASLAAGAPLREIEPDPLVVLNPRP